MSQYRTFEWEDWNMWSVPAIMNEVKERSNFQSIGSMTFGDALWSQEGMGIYIFYDRNYTPLYIGKVGSRSFLERISGHLDTHMHKGGSETGWFNTFQKRWVSYFQEEDIEAKKNYLENIAFHTLQIPAGDSDKIKKIEKLMIHYYNPILNKGTKISDNSIFAYLRERVNEHVLCF